VLIDVASRTTRPDRDPGVEQARAVRLKQA
jgi:hypothetical protein